MSNTLYLIAAYAVAVLGLLLYFLKLSRDRVDIAARLERAPEPNDVADWAVSQPTAGSATATTASASPPSSGPEEARAV
jgi:hypothetical protein